MKRYYRFFALTLMLSLCLPVSPALAGETIFFDGTNLTLLRPDPIWNAGNSLFPTASLSDNTITVTAGTIAAHTYGAVTTTNADVATNKVSITGGTVGRSVFGAYTTNGNALNNETTIQAGATVNWGAYGGFSDNGDALNNKVTITGGSIGQAVFGGRGGLTASGNEVSITDASVASFVNGGYSKNGNALNNKVSLAGTTQVGDNVHGGYSATSGTAAGNSVNISSSAIASKSVYGGWSDSGEVSGNSVTITGGTVDGTVYGGWSNSGKISDNSVTISGGTIGQHAYGGFSSSGEVSGNNVTISGGSIGQHVYGGSSTSGEVSGNNVTISGGAVGWSAIGGLSASGEVSGNNVTISGGTIGASVYGGFSSSSGNVSGNTVTISGGEVKDSVVGGWSNKDTISGNTIIISGSTVGNFVYGGSSVTGDVTGNSVTISGSTIGKNVYGGFSSSTVSGNTVTIAGSTIGGSVYGGSNLIGDVTGNSVTISDSTIEKSVYGGFSFNGDVSGNSITILAGTINEHVTGGFSGKGDATHNTVTLGTGANLAATSNVSGGLGRGSDIFTGNTLNLLGWQGTVDTVANFENYAFALPAAIAHGDTMITATAADLTDGAGRSSKVTNLTITSGGRAQQVGERFTLIDASAGTLTTTGINTTTQGSKGLSLFYDFTVETNALPDSLTATITGVQVNPQTKTFSEGRAANMAFINQGADLAAGQGMHTALAATRNDAYGISTFGTMIGGSSRYETGSHVDVEGVSLLAGLAWNAPLPTNKLLVGAFFEAGWGNYDSHNSFSNAASIKGDGDTEYYGGGLLARYELTEGQLKGLYTEASARAGWTTTDFSSSDLHYNGQDADYDSSAAYYGAHAGLGYIWQANEAISLDVSTKYLWTHQDSDSVTVHNDPVSFKESDSHRLRTGARLSYTISEQVTPYIGAAYEYEFDGDARATVYGFDIDTPTLEGGTGIGEFGLSLKPAADSAFTADVAIQGYTGTREGVTGSFQLRYEF